ncbi:FAD-dependent oxidoreductase, partial [bacterium]|nr:FAD-dependent oxidoreductase [bacterium]
MVAIDLRTVPIRTANEMLRGYGATHQDVELLNPEARHYIGVGLTSPIAVRVRGSAGYYCGGLCDGPHFVIEGNASWGVGDNLLLGSIVVQGNAGAVAGEGLRGGEIVVKRNLGSRAGQVMKKGTLCCAGNANFMAGYMMYGGRLIILGNSGERVGQDMMGGEIYVGGQIDSLGTDARLDEPTAAELDDLRAFLDRYQLPFNGTFQKVVCAGKLLKYATPEPRLRRLPFTTFSGGRRDYWNPKVEEDIRVKSITGRYRIRGYGAARHLPHFPDIAFKADLSGVGRDADVVSRVNLRTFLGDKHQGRALDLSMPLMIAPMSYGALSAGMKAALAIASRLSGISENSGEGGMLSVERAEARQIIAQCLAGRLGWNIHDMKRADGVEIYISQGAKPGLGGQLMAEKLTQELAAVRGIPPGMDLRSPSRHPDVLGGDDLIMKVAEFREATGGRVPVSIKLGAGRIRDDIKIALKDGLDFVELDGLQGGTGAAPDEVLEFVGIPTIAGLEEALAGLEEIDAAGQLPIVLMGGVKDGVDALKAIALGATAVGMGTAMLIAGGCITCMQCSVGSCVIGAATQDADHTGRLNTEKKSLQIHCFLEAVRWQMAAIVHALGYTDIRQVSRKDLVALTPEAAQMLQLPYEPDHRENLRRQLADGEAAATPLEIHGEYHDPAYTPAPCQEGCPVGTDVPSYLGLIWRGEFTKAFEVLSANNPFSTVCGRVCSKPCETACRRGDSDQAATIRGLKRFVAEQVGPEYSLPPVPVTQTKTVGIVGAGPAGLTAAQDLAEAGYAVHLYERSDRLGGMMTAGIPPFRCPPRLLNEDVDRILKHCPGIVPHLNCALGRDVSLDELKQRHDAVLLAIGLWRDRQLGIPGEEPGLQGLHGIQFLVDVNQGRDVKVGRQVVVIGGGNVAIDAARTALRAGAKQVQLYFLETRDTMPAWEHEVREAVAEGVLLNPSWGPKQILRENGRATGVEFMRCTSVFDDQGRFAPQYDPRTTETVTCDAILTAIGLTVDDPGLGATGLIRRGLVQADSDTMRTSDPQVFAAGDGA